MPAVAITTIVCASLLFGLWLALRAQPRTDRWQEMERVLTTLETRCKLLEQQHVAHGHAITEHYIRLDTLKGQSFAPLTAVAELREELSKGLHDAARAQAEVDARCALAERAVEVVGAEFKRQLETVSRLSQTVGTMATRGMRTG